jgi:hypothetical protein
LPLSHGYRDWYDVSLLMPPAFESPTGMPYLRVNRATGTTE